MGERTASYPEVMPSTTNVRRSVSVLLTLATCAASAVIGLVGLASASGVTRLSRNDYDTEFLHPSTLMVALGLVVPVFCCAWLWPRAGGAAVLAAVVPQVATAHRVVSRYQESGWGDGLEVLSYLLPIIVGVACAIAALAGWGLRRHQR